MISTGPRGKSVNSISKRRRQTGLAGASQERSVARTALVDRDANRLDVRSAAPGITADAERLSGPGLEAIGGRVISNSPASPR